MNRFWVKISRKILSYFITLFLLVSIIFILIRIAPGDPAQRFVSPDLHPSIAEKMRNEFALNESLFAQYGNFVKNIFSGDLGFSYNYRMPVSTVIWSALPFTIAFSITSFAIQLLVSVLLIIFISKRRGKFLDRLLGNLSISIYSIPTMIIGLILLFLFSVQLEIFPLSDLYSIHFPELNLFEKIFDIIWHMFLPLMTLSLPGILIFYSYLRNNIENTFQKNYILFLRANGENEKNIFSKHVLPNSFSPLISIMGVELGILLGGALITETIFSLPGMGRLTVHAILMRDYPLIIGTVLISGIFVLLTNFIADLIKINFDKRLKAEFF